GFARAVRAEKRYKLALLHRQVDAFDGVDVAILAVEQSAYSRSQALLLLVYAVGLAQIADLDDRHGPKIIGTPRGPGQGRGRGRVGGMVSRRTSCDIGGAAKSQMLIPPGASTDVARHPT